MIGERPLRPSWDAGWWHSFWVRAEWFDAIVGPNGGIAVSCDPSRDPRGRNCFRPGQLNNEADRFHLWGLQPGGDNFLIAEGVVKIFPYSFAIGYRR
jgi:hypothetical protein